MTRKRGTVFQWLAGLVSHSSNQMDMEWDEDDKMLHLGTPVPVILSGNLNTAGTIQPNSATGTVPVTEASAATISASGGNLSGIATYTGIQRYSGQDLTVGDATAVLADSLVYHHRRKVVTLAAADGGGAVAATNLVTTVAGYYPVLDSLLFYSTVADTFTATIGVDAGALVGPAAHSITTVASTINTQLENGLWYDLTDASQITIAIAGATVGMVIVCVLEYHYET